MSESDGEAYESHQSYVETDVVSFISRLFSTTSEPRLVQVLSGIPRGFRGGGLSGPQLGG